MKNSKRVRKSLLLVIFLLVGIVSVHSVYGEEQDKQLEGDTLKIIFSGSETSPLENNSYLEKSEILGVVADSTVLKVSYKLDKGYTFFGYFVSKEISENGKEVLVTRLYKKESSKTNSEDVTGEITIDLSNVNAESQLQFIIK
ncbi:MULTISPECIES: hypothetical protein [Enterococcus]|uniref:hypothetical protein n=1 Tax=Enterococcus TaxID=1350 RepID=UPI0008A43AA0|nr:MULTISPECIES: hypothetical protein [Enterococcus]EGP4766884.1 hypothetical protein [Enterococcus faecium]EGP4862764.1 hypothetical protein [Enterococcus faecium]EGP5144230.1 hypothetical protein [Enterococcus faecium]EGP5248332.1 hypothetical protein [Enterococcus faecium]EGP5391692.1 hypothetical protein [Enterococcus faecium]